MLGNYNTLKLMASASTSLYFCIWQVQVNPLYFIFLQFCPFTTVPFVTCNNYSYNGYRHSLTGRIDNSIPLPPHSPDNYRTERGSSRYSRKSGFVPLVKTCRQPGNEPERRPIVRKRIHRLGPNNRNISCTRWNAKILNWQSRNWTRNDTNYTRHLRPQITFSLHF